MQVQIETREEQEMVDITDKVNSALEIDKGVCNVFALHSTAAVIINENWDTNIGKDCFEAWNRAIPPDSGYEHDKVDGNAQSHIIAALLGPQETIPVRDGKLLLGKWQSVMLVELDGPRTRNIEISAIKQKK